MVFLTLSDQNVGTTTRVYGDTLSPVVSASGYGQIGCASGPIVFGCNYWGTANATYAVNVTDSMLKVGAIATLLNGLPGHPTPTSELSDTFTQGKWMTTTATMTRDLILDAAGNTTAIFVFQVSGTFDIGTPSTPVTM